MGRGPVVAGQKQAGAQARAKIFSLHSKLIALAAQRGADPHDNPSLAEAMEKARKDNVTADMIDRAIRRGAGLDKDSAEVIEIFYEGYALGGVAVVVRALTDNRNRTAPSMRHIFSKYGGNLGETGSVSGFAFRHHGTVYLPKTSNSNEALEEMILESGASDYAFQEDGTLRLETDTKELMHVVKFFRETGITPEEYSFDYTPTNKVEVTDFDKGLKIYKLLEDLEADDDVEYVWHTAEFTPEVLTQIQEAVEKAKFRT